MGDARPQLKCQLLADDVPEECTHDLRQDYKVLIVIIFLDPDMTYL
jgi:hypothetical protein